MIGKEVITKIKQLHSEGNSVAYIARELKIGYPTAKKYASASPPTAGMHIPHLPLEKNQYD